MAGIKHKAAKVSHEKLYAVEWNDDHEIDGDVDFAKHQAKNLVFEKLAAPPGSPVEGQTYYDTVQKKAYYYNGTVWKEFCPVTGADETYAIAPSCPYVINPSRDQSLVESPSSLFEMNPSRDQSKAISPTTVYSTAVA
jgi:hypothetical protein